MAIFWILLGGIVLTCGDVIFRFFWAHSQNKWLYIIGLLTYLVGLIFLVESYRYENIAVASAAIVITNIVLLAIVSWIFFDQRLSIMQGLGILIALIAIYILEMF